MPQKRTSQPVPNFNERNDRDAAIIQLASIVESSGDAIFGETLQGVITSWNNSAENLFGYTADEVLGNSISLISPPDRHKEVVEIAERVMKGEVVKNYETTRVSKDGTLIEVSITVSPIRDSTGTIIAASTIVHDITKQKRMIQELATRTHELEDLVEELATRTRELQGSNEELATRTHELQGSNKELATRSRELEDSNEELATRTRELERSNKELVTRSRELEGSNKDLAIRTDELEGSNEELATRTHELQDSNEELATRSRELQGSNEELATRTYELERSNKKLAIRSRELEGSNKDLAARTRELERSNKDLATRTRELEGSNKDLVTRSRELERSNKDLATRSRELQGSNEELATRTHELEGSNEELATRSRELERSNKELATRSRELERSNEELATRTYQLERSNKDLGARSRELERSNKDLATRSRELQGSNEDLATRTHELEDSNEELATRSRELEGSNKDLATRSRELEGSNEELAIRTHELEGSNKDLATRSRELERSNKDLATRSRELERSNKDLATRSRELEGSNKELATRSRELEGSNEELATRTHELEGSNEELATRSRELEGSNEELATRTRELERSNEELATRSRELEGSNEELATRTHELEGSNKKLAARSRELEGLNKELAARTRELERSNKELATRTHQLEGSNEELAIRSRALERSNAAMYQLAAIVESSGEAIIGKTLQGVITSWNSSAEKLFGYSADEIIGKSISLIIPPDHQIELQEILARVTAGETIPHYETIRLRKDSTHLQVSMTVSPIRDPGGKIIAASTIAHDISEQKRMVEELMALNSALEEANRARSQFLATMSHELRTPLTSIIGFSQMMLDDSDIANLNQEQHSDVERILKNGQHLLSLINDVLDLTKIDASRMVVSYSQVDVRELLTSVVEETQSIAIARHLVMRVEVDEGIDFIESNPLKLRQILLNLVSNALKFTEQGEVTISARRVIPSDQEGECIALAVKDSGIGMPAEIQAHIFEAFYQADGSYTRKAGGTGLGLSIVNELTALLGGTVTVKSTADQGSTFTVILPIKAGHHPIEQDIPRLQLAQPVEITGMPPSTDDLLPAMIDEAVAVSAHQADTEGQNYLILSVDDNPDVNVFIKAALKDTPYTVIGLQDSSKAMELAEELHPCAILLDVMMPNVNGWQLLYQLKVNPVTASIPVMILTVIEEQTTGYVLGADTYLKKPFKTEVLLDNLKNLLASQKGPSQAI